MEATVAVLTATEHDLVRKVEVLRFCFQVVIKTHPPSIRKSRSRMQFFRQPLASYRMLSVSPIQLTGETQTPLSEDHERY